MKSIEVTEVVVHATPGSSVGECIKEALQIAVTEWRNVRLIHNQKAYKVQVNDLVGAVIAPE